MKKEAKKDPNELVEMVVAEGSVKTGAGEYVQRGEAGSFPRQDIDRKPGKFVTQEEWDAMSEQEAAQAKLDAIRSTAPSDEEEEVEEVAEDGSVRKSRRKKHR